MTHSRRGVPVATGAHFARWFPIAVALLGILLTTSPLFGQETSAKKDRVLITGQVLDGLTRLPVKGAWVELEHAGRQTFTDENGRFAFREMRAGTHEIEVEQLGYERGKLVRSFDQGTGAVVIALTPDPVVLEGIHVVNDRLASRRRTATTSVLAYDLDRIRESPAFDAQDFVRQRIMTTSCPRIRLGSTCVIRRGRVVSPQVYIDEVQVPGGMDFLAGLSTQDLYLVEIYGSGAQIRVYTQWFAEHLARGRASLTPVILF